MKLESVVEGKTSMRIWFKEWKENQLMCDYVVEDDSLDTRTHKIMRALDEACVEFDLSRPIWLDLCIADFKRTGKARFYADSFIDDILFDYMEIQVLDEDSTIY